MASFTHILESDPRMQGKKTFKYPSGATSTTIAIRVRFSNPGIIKIQGTDVTLYNTSSFGQKQIENNAHRRH